MGSVSGHAQIERAFATQRCARSSRRSWCIDTAAALYSDLLREGDRRLNDKFIELERQSLERRLMGNSAASAPPSSPRRPPAPPPSSQTFPQRETPPQQQPRGYAPASGGDSGTSAPTSASSSGVSARSHVANVGNTGAWGTGSSAMRGTASMDGGAGASTSTNSWTVLTAAQQQGHSRCTLTQCPARASQAESGSTDMVHTRQWRVHSYRNVDRCARALLWCINRVAGPQRWMCTAGANTQCSAL